MSLHRKITLLGNSKMLYYLSVAAFVLTIPVALYVAQSRQDIRQGAWSTSQSAKSICYETGEAAIAVSFTNTESNRYMLVNAVDQQTGHSEDLGTVAPMQTVSTKLATGKTSLAAGNIIFNLAWSNNPRETDVRSGPYAGIVCPQPQPTATPAPTLTATPTVTPIPSATPIPTTCSGYKGVCKAVCADSEKDQGAMDCDPIREDTCCIP